MPTDRQTVAAARADNDAPPLMVTDVDSVDSDLVCPECDYQLIGVTGDRCPWCGWTIDPRELAASASSRHSRLRWGVAGSALVVGAGSLVALKAMLGNAAGLAWRDGLAVIAVLMAAVGHLALSAVIAMHRRRWPMRAGETARILRFVGWLSIASAVAAATVVLSVAPTPRVVRGVQVNGILEFVMTAVFLAMPGVLLLMLRMVSYRSAGQGLLAWFDGRSSDAQSLDVGAPFIVEVDRPFVETQVDRADIDESRPTSPVVEELIARTWEAETRLAAESGRTLYNGRLARLLSAEATTDRLYLRFAETCYRDFLCTNLLNARKVARIHRAMLADAVGTSSIVLTTDGYLVLGRRSDRVAFHTGFLHTFGGMLEAADRTNDGYDVFSGARRELMEELDLRAFEITNMTLTGLVRDRAILQPELVFDASVSLGKRELADRFRHDLSGGEHLAIEFIADDPDGVVNFLSRAAQVAPAAQGALLLHGRHQWGAAWYDRACLSLYGGLPASANSL